MAGLLDGRIVLVTGSAAGIGRAIAERAGREGARLVLGDIAEDGAEVAAKLSKGGVKAAFLKTDVRRAEDIAALVAAAKKDYGAVPDCVFANAGIEGRPAPAWEVSEAEFTRVIDVNLIGVWRTMAAVLPAMVAAKRGSIVATSSVAGIVGAGGLGAYVASKHAVAGLVKSTAIDVARLGIRVNAICPGMVATAMVDRLAEQVAGFEDALLAMKPMARLGTPDEIANAAVWLASDQASFITGHTMVIDGGYAAQ
ncbi:MAG: glucose 1-dehydrogenase [Alphaproteobacteria bacterium]|nr:glucose 1-dehydrogenase [Alphaproteobacteria bacterium]